MNSLIFGLFVVVLCNRIWIYGSIVAVTNPEKNVKINATMEIANLDKNWFDALVALLRPPEPTPFPEAKPDMCPPCKCGLANTERRIVGGIETKKNQYPWMALLLDRGRFYCAGSVINSRYILTAAHCVQGFGKERMIIRIGDYDRSTTHEAVNQDFRVADIIIHSGFSQPIEWDNDIALIKIRGVIKFHNSMRPVCLAEKALAYVGEKAIVTGWGATEAGGATSDTLREVVVPIISNRECRSWKYSANRITDNMLCAGERTGGKDSCQGDSGGPLHVYNKATKIHRVVGVVSWGEGCALPNYPGVYARVNRYLSWIEKHTEDACYCT